ncbi:MAG: hypothetical protein AMXMBFR33_34400 [Candidatus Xenobia bacterium]
MSKGSAKKPKPAKSRGSGTPLEGRAWVRVGGARWLREDAEKAGKFIPKEYREGYVKPLSKKAAEELAASAAAEAAAAEEAALAANVPAESAEALEAAPDAEDFGEENEEA